MLDPDDVVTSDDPYALLQQLRLALDAGGVPPRGGRTESPMGTA